MKLVVVACMVGVLGCSPGPRRLVVDVRTDLVPSSEFDRVVLRITDDEGTELGTGDAAARSAHDFIRGTRVLELEGFADRVASATIHTQLMLDDREVAAQATVVTLRGRATAVTVLITRSCLGVECTDATRASCLAGACVEARCTSVGGAAACGEVGECEATSDCDDAHPCGGTACVGGACLSAPAPTCGPTERCEGTVGCVSLDADAGCGPPDLVLDLKADGNTLNAACGDFVAEVAGDVPYGAGRLDACWEFRSEQANQGPDPDAVEARSLVEPTLESGLTVDIWARESTFNAYGGSNRFLAATFFSSNVIGESGDWSLYLHENGQVYFSVHPGSGGARGADWQLCSFGMLVEGAWHQLTATFDGANVVCYLDRAESNRAPTTGTLAPLSYVEVGRNYPGDIDSIRLWSRALSETEVAALSD